MEMIFPPVGLWVGAEQQWRDLTVEMREHLPERLCNDLVYRAMNLSQQVTQSFLLPISNRLNQFDQLNRTGGLTGAGSPPRSKSHKSNLRSQAAQTYRRRLLLMNPAEVAKELAPGLNPPDLGEYNRIVADLARALPHPDLANRYGLPPQALDALAEQVAAAGRPVAQALHEHAMNLKAHADLVATLRTQPLVQKGARLIGKAVVTALEPLVGRGAAEQLFGLDNPLARSYEQVEMGWNSFRREFMEFQEERKRRHQLVYLSLVAGLFIGVQKDLRHLGCELAMDGQGNVVVLPLPARQERLRHHFVAARKGVLSSLRAAELEPERLLEAERLASALISQVVTDPVVAGTSLEERSVGYWAYALHLSTLLARARDRWGAGKPEEAAAIWREIFERYPCLVADQDLTALVGEELPLVTAGFRLAAYAEWLRDSNRPGEADRLLRAQIGYVNRWVSRTKQFRGLPGESLSPELVDWSGALVGYLRQTGQPEAGQPPSGKVLPMRRYPVVHQHYRQAIGASLERSGLDRFLRHQVNLNRGVVAAAVTGGLGLVSGLAWLLLL